MLESFSGVSPLFTEMRLNESREIEQVFEPNFQLNDELYYSFQFK